jgi:hypothetical protein
MYILYLQRNKLGKALLLATNYLSTSSVKRRIIKLFKNTKSHKTPTNIGLAIQKIVIISLKFMRMIIYIANNTQLNIYCILAVKIFTNLQKHVKESLLLS